MVRGDFGTDPILPRAFSLVAVGESGAILVRAVGKATRRLAQLKPSDPLSVLAPLGNTFIRPLKSHRPILVAGGVGVAPLIFLAETLYSQGNHPMFFYGGRTADDILFKDRISRVSELIVTTENGSAGEQGLVTEAVDSFLSKEGSDVLIYTCGPEPMMAALNTIARKRRLPLQASLEQSMACGVGTCKGCAVHGINGGYNYVCSDGPVFRGEETFGGDT